MFLVRFIKKTPLLFDMENGTELASHLTILIRRVREVPLKLKKQPSFYNKLLSLVDYMRYEDNYTRFEERKANAILKAYGLFHLTKIDDEIEYQEKIKNLPIFEEKYIRSCMRCGRNINPFDLKNGYGPRCLKKRQIVDESPVVEREKSLKDFFER